MKDLRAKEWANQILQKPNPKIQVILTILTVNQGQIVSNDEATTLNDHSVWNRLQINILILK